MYGVLTTVSQIPEEQEREKVHIGTRSIPRDTRKRDIIPHSCTRTHTHIYICPDHFRHLSDDLCDGRVTGMTRKIIHGDSNLRSLDTNRTFVKAGMFLTGLLCHNAIKPPISRIKSRSPARFVVTLGNRPVLRCTRHRDACARMSRRRKIVSWLNALNSSSQVSVNASKRYHISVAYFHSFYLSLAINFNPRFKQKRETNCRIR